MFGIFGSQKHVFSTLDFQKKKNWFLFILCRYRYLICWAKKEKVDDDDFQFCAKNWLIRNSIACAKITKLTKNLYNLQLFHSTCLVSLLNFLRLQPAFKVKKEFISLFFFDSRALCNKKRTLYFYPSRMMPSQKSVRYFHMKNIFQKMFKKFFKIFVSKEM